MNLKNIDTGDVLIFEPDLNDSDCGFNMSEQSRLMKEHNVIRMVIELKEGQYGFQNTFTYDISLQREDNSYVTNGEVRDPKFVTEEEIDDKFIEVCYDVQFLGYLSNYLEFIKISS